MLSRIGAGGCCVTHTSIRGLAPQAGGFRRHPNTETGSWPKGFNGCLPHGQRVSYQFTCFPYHTPIRDRLPDPFHKILANHITSRGHKGYLAVPPSPNYTFAPHSGQNFMPVLSSVPHEEHFRASGAPHSEQNFAFDDIEAPQAG